MSFIYSVIPISYLVIPALSRDPEATLHGFADRPLGPGSAQLSLLVRDDAEKTGLPMEGENV